jgi:O-antigen/teichoic acid export membrane protein
MAARTDPLAHLSPPLSERNETELERADRHLAELLQEVRVAQTGVQVLFGFLLTAPFTTGFDRLSVGERRLYFATLCLAGAAAMLLIAPSAQHRVLFRCGDKPHLIRRANRYAMAGLACVALAMVGALVFVAAVVSGGVLATAAGVVAGAASAWCWYVQPLLRRRRLLAHVRERPAIRRAGSSPAPRA